jgi:hypothetical protein
VHNFLLFYIPGLRPYSVLVSKMNWTGGSLQRTKHANKGVVQKQKAFFAKARTHLQNSPKSPATPFRPTYLQNDSSFELSSHLPPFEASPIQHTRHSAQRRLESIQRSSSPVDHTFADGDGLKSTLRKGRQEPSDGNASATRLRGSELRGMLTSAVTDMSMDIASVLMLLQMNNVRSAE